MARGLGLDLHLDLFGFLNSPSLPLSHCFLSCCSSCNCITQLSWSEVLTVKAASSMTIRQTKMSCWHSTPSISLSKCITKKKVGIKLMIPSLGDPTPSPSPTWWGRRQESQAHWHAWASAKPVSKGVPEWRIRFSRICPCPKSRYKISLKQNLAIKKIWLWKNLAMKSRLMKNGVKTVVKKNPTVWKHPVRCFP